jgi:GR25 family glycosyltransferase involved in LPS biosynthesis
MNTDILPKLPYNIYYINLDRRPDRKIHMEHILQNNSATRIQAVDYQNNFSPYNVLKGSIITLGAYACTCSHIIALNTYLTTSTDEYAFIAEDDIENTYSQYWKKYHYDLLTSDKFDILQMQTTSDKYNNNNMTEIKLSESGAALYRIRRNIAQKIVDTFYNKVTNTIDLTIHNYPVADKLIWDFGSVYLIPMVSYLNVKDSDTMPENNDMNEYWTNFFSNAKTKYLQYWKNI